MVDEIYNNMTIYRLSLTNTGFLILFLYMLYCLNTNSDMT